MANIQWNLITTREKRMYGNNHNLNNMVEDYIFVFKKPVINFYNNIYPQYSLRSVFDDLS